MPLSTVSGILTRIGMGKLGRLGMEPALTATSASDPASSIHVDVKKLGRIQGGAGKRIYRRSALHRAPTPPGRRRCRRRINGWDFVHVAIDDATRLAYAEVLPDEKATHRDRVPRRAVAFFTPATA